MQINLPIAIGFFSIVLMLFVISQKMGDVCLTGHDIDARIQQNYLEAATAPQLPTPAEKD